MLKIKSSINVLNFFPRNLKYFYETYLLKSDKLKNYLSNINDNLANFLIKNKFLELLLDYNNHPDYLISNSIIKNHLLYNFKDSKFIDIVF